MTFKTDGCVRAQEEFLRFLCENKYCASIVTEHDKLDALLVSIDVGPEDPVVAVELVEDDWTTTGQGRTFPLSQIKFVDISCA